MAESADREATSGMLAYIDASPSPWHAVANAVARLRDAGFSELPEGEPWDLRAGGRYYTVRDGSSLIAFAIGSGPPAEHGFRVIGAHTDSPGLRVKPRAPQQRGPMAALGVEVYGAPILATFTDRDLTLAGRVLLDGADGPEARLVHFGRPLVRLPNLAIHMNREVNEQGLKLDAQEELPLLLAAARDELPPDRQFRALVADELGVDAGRISAWELAAADTQPGTFYGPEREFIAAGRLDNLASCHAGLEALLSSTERDAAGTRICAFFDHEEVGSQSYKGAEGTFLGDVLTRIASGLGLGPDDHRRALANGLVMSADMAHAYQPAFARFYDAEHQALANGGPVLKINAKQRYATDGVAEALFHRLCRAADVPGQVYVHRTDLPCGSTIGPITAARLGMRCLDVGNPMWAMHSIRESAGADDHPRMIALMRAFLEM